MTIELLNIDCMEYMATQEDRSFDLAIVDPPYFDGPNKLGYYGARVSSTGVDRPGYEKTKEWDVPKQDYFDELLRVSKNQIIWGINYYDIRNIGSGRIVWDKVNGKTTFSDCEIAYCSLHDSVRMYSFMWNGFMQGVNANNGKIQQGNKKLNEKRIHPTQKPRALYYWLLHQYAEPGQKILDTHLGSGSSAIEADHFGVDFVGCELNKLHFKGALSRFHDAQRQADAFRSTAVCV